ncbi:MAG: DUF4331 domain-containing protein, partial [Gammaproteobacteria bacterium]|nr:DUF4331 domain-containing protein [Gammaproteobacteria bacterium]
SFSVIAVAGLLFAGAVFAADHVDAPLIAQDPAADLGDVYAFVNPNDSGEVILAATVAPFAMSGSRFSNAVEYRFNLQNTAAGAQAITITCRFSGQAARCRGSSGINVTSQIGRTAEHKGVRLFAGLRDDPFFFDGVAFNATVATLVPQFTDPGQDTFEGANVLAIVLGIDSDLLSNGGADPVLRFYASTHRRVTDDDDEGDNDGAQLDRTGRPGITTALIDLLASTGKKDQYNQAADIDTWASLFEDEIAANLAALDTLDGVVDNNLLPPPVLASVLVDDRLIIDVSNPVCDAYLAVELGVPQCGGRTLERDVIDDTFGAVVGPGVSDFVGNTSVFLDQFPFLGEPN